MRLQTMGPFFFLCAAVGLVAAVGGCSRMKADTPPVPALSTPALAKPALATPAQVQAIASDPAIKKVAEANNDFGFRLLHTLYENAGGNAFFSPLSISSALMMTINGAGGKTKQEMAQTLGVPGVDIATVNDGYGQLLPYLGNPDKDVDLSIANALWVQQGLKFDSGFQNRCQASYGAQTVSLDLQSQAGADSINQWCDENTHGKIPQIVSPNDLMGSVAVLTDAIYFHGNWSSKFDKAATQQGPFHLENGSDKQVPLMSQTGAFPYFENAQFQAIAMPYSTGRLSFYVFLPKTGISAGSLAGSLNRTSWDDWTKGFEDRDVHITLPRFHVDDRLSLADALGRMGMPDAFSPAADFTPMGLGSNVSISEVIHKAMMDVDEEGTTAAAATAVIMTEEATAMPVRQPPIEMRVDHPFFCAIRDNTTGAILFEGVVRDPQ